MIWPLAWDGILRRRDGVNSGAEVKVYAAKVPDVNGMTDDARGLEPFTGIVDNARVSFTPLWECKIGSDIEENEGNKENLRD